MGSAASPPLFTGVGVALVSLFSEDGDLLLEDTAAHARRLVDRGVRAVLVSGTTGEAWSLNADERAALAGACREAVPGDVPVLVGAGAPDADEALRLTAALADCGADALLVLAPPGLQDAPAFYGAIAEAAGGRPVYAYHMPAIALPGVPVEILPQLPVRGIKDSSGSADRLVATLHRYGGEIHVGSPTLLALAGPLGATGALLALANTDPEQCARAFGGDMAAQRALIDPHVQSVQDFPAALKRMMAERYGTPAAVRAVRPAVAGPSR